jgi:hypothetical protein
MRSASPNSTPFFGGLRVSPERASGSNVVHRFASGAGALGEGACKDAGAERVIVLFGPIEPATVNAKGTKRAQKRRSFDEMSNDSGRRSTLTW